MALTVVLKGSATSGNYGHAGRPGKRGGSTRRHNLVIATYKDTRPGYRKPTDKEIEVYYNAINNLSEGIQKIRPSNERITLTIKDNAAVAFGPAVELDAKYLIKAGRGWRMTAEHEYIHTLVANNKKLNKIEYEYHPPFLYAHAAHYGDDMWTVLNEQFTMTMTAHDDDPDVWLDRVMHIESYERVHTKEEAQSQIDSITDYLKRVKLW